MIFKSSPATVRVGVSNDINAGGILLLEMETASIVRSIKSFSQD
jgi:hypothetical protein